MESNGLLAASATNAERSVTTLTMKSSEMLEAVATILFSVSTRITAFGFVGNGVILLWCYCNTVILVCQARLFFFFLLPEGDSQQ